MLQLWYCLDNFAKKDIMFHATQFALHETHEKSDDYKIKNITLVDYKASS